MQLTIKQQINHRHSALRISATRLRVSGYPASLTWTILVSRKAPRVVLCAFLVKGVLKCRQVSPALAGLRLCGVINGS